MTWRATSARPYDAEADADKFWEEMLPDAARKARDDAAADPYDIDERFRVDGPRKRQRVETYKEVDPGRYCRPRHPTISGPHTHRMPFTSYTS